MVTKRTLQDIVNSGALSGYRPGAPPPTPLGGPEIDEEVCQQATCAVCGTTGLEYAPFIAPRSYRAFAVCPACGHAEEF